VPYSKSIGSITKVQDELKLLITSKSDIVFPSDNPNKLAWVLRSAINSAITNGVKDVAALKAKYLIKIKGGKVVAELRDKVAKIAELEELINKDELILRDVTNLMELVTSLSVYRETKVLKFPHVNLNEDEIRKLGELGVKRNFLVLSSKDRVLPSKIPESMIEIKRNDPITS